MQSVHSELSQIKIDGKGGFDLHQIYLALLRLFSELNAKNVYLPNLWELSGAGELPSRDALILRGYDYIAFGFAVDDEHMIAVWGDINQSNIKLFDSYPNYPYKNSLERLKKLFANYNSVLRVQKVDSPYPVQKDDNWSCGVYVVEHLLYAYTQKSRESFDVQELADKHYQRYKTEQVRQLSVEENRQKSLRFKQILLDALLESEANQFVDLVAFLKTEVNIETPEKVRHRSILETIEEYKHKKIENTQIDELLLKIAYVFLAKSEKEFKDFITYILINKEYLHLTVNAEKTKYIDLLDTELNLCLKYKETDGDKLNLLYEILFEIFLSFYADQANLLASYLVKINAQEYMKEILPKMAYIRINLLARIVVRILNFDSYALSEKNRILKELVDQKKLEERKEHILKVLSSVELAAIGPELLLVLATREASYLFVTKYIYPTLWGPWSFVSKIALLQEIAKINEATIAEALNLYPTSNSLDLIMKYKSEVTLSDLSIYFKHCPRHEILLLCRYFSNLFKEPTDVFNFKVDREMRLLILKDLRHIIKNQKDFAEIVTSLPSRAHIDYIMNFLRGEPKAKHLAYLAALPKNIRKELKSNISAVHANLGIRPRLRFFPEPRKDNFTAIDLLNYLQTIDETSHLTVRTEHREVALPAAQYEWWGYSNAVKLADGNIAIRENTFLFSESRLLQIINSVSRQILRIIEVDDPISSKSMCLLPDGNILVGGENPVGNFHIYDPISGKEINRFPQPKIGYIKINATDDKIIAIPSLLSAPVIMDIFNLDGTSHKRIYDPYFRPALASAINNSHAVYLGEDRGVRHCRVYELSTGEYRQIEFKYSHFQISFISDNQFIIADNFNGIGIYNVLTLERITHFEKLQFMPSCIKVKDNRLILGNSSGVIHIYDLTDGALEQVINLNERQVILNSIALEYFYDTMFSIDRSPLVRISEGYSKIIESIDHQVHDDKRPANRM